MLFRSPSSLLPAARAAAERNGVEARDVLVELGRRRAVTGQDDLAETVAIGLAAEVSRA